MTADPGPRLEIGRITRPHGLRGEVLVALTTTESSRLDAGSTVSTPSGTLTVGAPIPTTGCGSWPSRASAREQAEALSGLVLTAEPKAAADDGDPSALWVHELVGARVRDAEGIDRGLVVTVLANPASDLLELESGALVPLRFVVGGVETTSEGRMVRVDPPPGLFD